MSRSGVGLRRVLGHERAAVGRPPDRAVNRAPKRGAVAAEGGATQALATDLRDLTLDLEAGGYSPTTVAMFRRNLRRAVPGALGASIFFEIDEPALGRLTVNLVDRTLDPAEIRAGLRFPLALFRASLVGWVFLYASTPMAFDDLAGSLRSLFDAPERDIERSPVLPSEPVVPSVAGLRDFSLVNHALGVLLHRGYSLSQARNAIRDRAATSQNDLTGVARNLLDVFATRPREETRRPAVVRTSGAGEP